MSLKPCPCGKVPTELQIVSAYRSKFLMASPNCCSEWMFEFRSDYLNPAAPECTALAVDAWNNMPRGQMKNQTVPVPADVLIAILGRLAPDGRFELRQQGVEPEILEDLYYQAKELLRDKEGFGQI